MIRMALKWIFVIFPIALLTLFVGVHSVFTPIWWEFPAWALTAIILLVWGLRILVRDLIRIGKMAQNAISDTQSP
jgi:hypothetical protein